MSSMKLLSLIAGFGFRSISIESKEEVLMCKGENFSQTLSLNFLNDEIGLLKLDELGNRAEHLAEIIAPLVMMASKTKNWDYACELFVWVTGAKNLVPEVTDWIGVYYKANTFWNEDTTDLILGPFLGEASEHQRIPLDKGLCGMALREKRVVNVGDVHQESEHIACSLKTNSELIVPLLDEAGEMIAELDIDCNKLRAFTPEIEKKFKDYALTFQSLK
jgi:L-methionine (R)-S-oxide reductase